MVAGILTADGYRVLAVESSAAAERELERHPGPVKLLIANLAGDGEKFARKLHPTQPELRLLGTDSLELKLPRPWLAPERQLGLSKPYALSELLKAARKVLDA